MSTFFEDENCNTVIWDSFKIDLCWSLKLSDPQNKKFKEPLFSDMPLSNDTIIVTVKCNEHVDKEIEFEIVELIDGIATPKSSIIYSGKVKANDDKGTEVDLKKAEGNKIYIIREKPKKGGEESFKCYDNPIKVGKEVLKGVYLFYSNWDNVKFEDFSFDEDAIKRRANEYIEIRMKTEGGRNGILLGKLPETTQKLIVPNDIVKNGIKALIEDKRKFVITLIDTPLYLKMGDDFKPLYYRVYGEYIPTDRIVMSTNTEREPDLTKINLTSQKDFVKKIDISKEKLFPRQKLTKESEFAQSGLWEYLYDATIDDIEDYNNNKEKYIRISLTSDEIINSVGAHEETHAFQKKVTELMCYAVELEAMKEYKDQNHE